MVKCDMAEMRNGNLLKQF